MLRQTAIPVTMTAPIVGSWATKASIEQDGSMRAMNADAISTIITGVLLGVLFWEWRILKSEIGDLRRDLTNQIAAINTRIDNELGGRR